jgi:hypothetical protein
MPGMHHVRHKLTEADRAAAKIAREHKREADRAAAELAAELNAGQSNG